MRIQLHTKSMSVCNGLWSVSKCFRSLTLVPRNELSTSTKAYLPDRRYYDNQTFYENVKYGNRSVRNNIRNLDRDIKNWQKTGVQTLSTVRIVDNSAKALAQRRRHPRVIATYNKRKRAHMGCVGQMVRITLNGEMHKALIVGQKQPMGVLKPRMDTNNVILLDNEGNPLGTRITVPIPAWLRGLKPSTRHFPAMSKVIAIASSFV